MCTGDWGLAAIHVRGRVLLIFHQMAHRFHQRCILARLTLHACPQGGGGWECVEGGRVPFPLPFSHTSARRVILMTASSSRSTCIGMRVLAATGSASGVKTYSIA